jgi:polysaccharide export outer membrane protein
MFVVLAGAVSLSAGGNEKTIPKELTQYVRDAQKAGMKPAQVRQSALKAGWPEATVDEAIASLGVAEPQNTATLVQKDVPKEAAPGATSEPGNPAAAPSAQGAAPNPVVTATETKLTTVTEAAAASQGAAVPGIEDEKEKAKAAAAEGARNGDYLIGEGDVLQISVWGEPSASVPIATVRPDGKISMPLIKDIQVAGLTPAQVEGTVSEKLSKLVRSPDVTVIVSQINSKKIFLTGAVKREGPLKYVYRMTVLQAISEAGGLTDYAKRKNIYVLHIENGRQYRFAFNHVAVLKGEHMEQNIVLSPGDIIVVP